MKFSAVFVSALLFLFLLLSSSPVEARPDWRRGVRLYWKELVAAPFVGAFIGAAICAHLPPRNVSRDASSFDLSASLSSGSAYYLPSEVPSVTTASMEPPSPTTPFRPVVSIDVPRTNRLHPPTVYPTFTVTETRFVSAPSTVTEFVAHTLTVTQTVHETFVVSASPKVETSTVVSWADFLASEAVDEFIFGPWYPVFLLVVSAVGYGFYSGFLVRSIGFGLKLVVHSLVVPAIIKYSRSIFGSLVALTQETSFGRGLVSTWHEFLLFLAQNEEERLLQEELASYSHWYRSVVKARRRNRSLLKRLRKACLYHRAAVNRILLQERASRIQMRDNRLRSIPSPEDVYALRRGRIVLASVAQPSVTESPSIELGPGRDAPVGAEVSASPNESSDTLKVDESIAEPAQGEISVDEIPVESGDLLLPTLAEEPVSEGIGGSLSGENDPIEFDSPLPLSPAAVGDSQEEPVVGNIQSDRETTSASNLVRDDDVPFEGEASQGDDEPFEGEASNIQPDRFDAFMDPQWKTYRDTFDNGDESDDDDDEDSDDEDSAAACCHASPMTSATDDISALIYGCTRLTLQVTEATPVPVLTQPASLVVPATLVEVPSANLFPPTGILGTGEGGCEATETHGVEAPVDNEMFEPESPFPPPLATEPAAATTLFTSFDLPQLREDVPLWLYEPEVTAIPERFETSGLIDGGMEVTPAAVDYVPSQPLVVDAVEPQFDMDMDMHDFAPSGFDENDLTLPTQTFSTSLPVDSTVVADAGFHWSVFPQEDALPPFDDYLQSHEVEETVSAVHAPPAVNTTIEPATDNQGLPRLVAQWIDPLPATYSLFPRTTPAANPSVTSPVADIPTSTEQSSDRPLPEDRAGCSRDVVGESDADRLGMDEVASGEDSSSEISSTYNEEDEDEAREARYLQSMEKEYLNLSDYDSDGSDNEPTFVCEPEEPKEPAQTRKKLQPKSRLRSAVGCKLQAGPSDPNGPPPPGPSPSGPSSGPTPTTTTRSATSTESASVENRAPPSGGAGSSTTGSRKRVASAAPTADTADDDGDLDREFEKAFEAADREETDQAGNSSRASQPSSERTVLRTTRKLGYLRPVTLTEDDDSADELELMVQFDEEGPPEWEELNAAIIKFRVEEVYGSGNPASQGDPDWVARHPYWLTQNPWYLGRGNNKNEKFRLTYGRQAIYTMKKLTEKGLRVDLARRKAVIQKQKGDLQRSEE